MTAVRPTAGVDANESTSNTLSPYSGSLARQSTPRVMRDNGFVFSNIAPGALPIGRTADEVWALSKPPVAHRQRTDLIKTASGDAHACGQTRSVKCRRQQRRTGLRSILRDFGQAIVSLRNHQHLFARLVVAHVGYLSPNRFVTPVEPASGERTKFARRGAQILGVVRKHRIHYAVRRRSSPDRRPTDRPIAQRRVQEALRSLESPHRSTLEETDNFCTYAHDLCCCRFEL